MALSRRPSQRMSGSIWPGFVDAMTALLLVLMFVLTIFMIVQFMLSETITGQESELDELASEVNALAQALGLEQQRSFSLDEQVTTLGVTIQTAQDRADAQSNVIDALTSQLETQSAELDQRAQAIVGFEAEVASFQAQVTSFEAQVAGLLSQRDKALEQGEALAQNNAQLEAARNNLITQQEAMQLALASARDEIDAQTETARLAAARRQALDALIADLRGRVSDNDVSLADALAELAGSQENMETLNTELSSAVASLATEQDVAAALQARLNDMQRELTEHEKTRLTEAAAAQALRQKLLNSGDELTAMTLALEEQRREAEEMLTLLAAAEAVKGDLTTKLAAALLAETALQEDATNAQVGQAEMVVRLNEFETALAAIQTDRDNLRSTLDTSNLSNTELTDRLTTAETALAAALAESKSLKAVFSGQDDLQTQLMAALAAKLAAEQDAAEQMTAAEQRAVLLSTANAALNEEEAKSADSLRRMAVLNQQISALRGQIGSLQALLEVAEAKDRDADIEITNLSSRLNTALARVLVEERARAELETAERERLEAEAKLLENYRSEFFGKMRAILGDREGVKIVGDRFVFSSEVLFEPSSADLAQDGRIQIARVAEILAEVSSAIPPEIDWVIRVDGHTDNTAMSGTGRYRDNWELSQARALSVVRFMIDELAFPATRLAATGFGEFQPLAAGDSPEALAQNRRIELKLTER